MASLGRFAATRILSGLLGLASVLVLARWMPVHQFAAYSLVYAAVMVAAIVGSLGIDRVLYREVPRAHMAGRPEEVVRLVRWALASRLLVAPAAAAIIVLATPSPALPRLQAVACAAALGSSVVIADVVGIVANALLRFEAQARLTIASLVFKLGVAYAMHAGSGHLSAVAMLLTAFIADLALAGVLYARAVKPALAPASQAAVLASYERPALRDLARSSGANYLSYLLGLPWQGSAATLFLGAFAGTSEVALFALLQGLLDRMRQYLPMQLLQNAFEPLLVRRYAATGDRLAVVVQVELLRRANYLLLAGSSAVVWAAGDELISTVTKGKYSQGGLLAAIMLAALAVRGISAAQFVSANVLGEMGRLTRVYAGVTAVTLPFVLWATHRYGALGVVLGSIAPSVLLWAGLRMGGAPSAFGLWRVRKDAAATAVAIVAGASGLAVKHALGAGWGVAAALGTTAGVYVALLALFGVFDRADRSLLRAGLRGHTA